MIEPVEFLLWVPDQPKFVATMAALTLPDGRHIARLPDPGEPAGVDIYFDDAVECSEIGAILKTLPVLDDDGNEIEPAEIVPGHHVNMRASGWLAELLTEGMPVEGGVFERTRILEFLGQMDWQASAVGEPPGYVGTSGIKIFDPDEIDHRYREWWS